VSAQYTVNYKITVKNDVDCLSVKTFTMSTTLSYNPVILGGMHVCLPLSESHRYLKVDSIISCRDGKSFEAFITDSTNDTEEYKWILQRYSDDKRYKLSV
jgi:hypothetical protein